MVRGVREIKRSQDPNALTNTSIKGEKDIIHDPSSEGRVPVLDGRTNSLMDERGQPVKVKPAMEKKVQPVMNRRVNPLLDRTGMDMDGTRRVNPAMDGIGRVNPAMDGTRRVNPPMDGTGGVNPAMDGTGRVNPAMDGTGRVNPAMDGTGRVNPPVDGTGRVNPPMEGRVRLNPAMERRFKDSSVQQHGPLTGSKETVPTLPSTKGMDLSPLSSKTKARSSEYEDRNHNTAGGRSRRYHSCQLSRFCRDSPGFLSLSRSARFTLNFPGFLHKPSAFQEVLHKPRILT